VRALSRHSALRNHFIVAALIGAALSFPSAHAQNTILERIQQGLDGIARSVNFVGEKADDLIGPGLGLDKIPEAAHTETRVFNDRYPVTAAPVVSISNEFGEIRVDTWEERVVQIAAEISVGAETADLAAELCRATDISVNHDETLVEIRTRLPDTRREMGVVSKRVDYVVTVPRGARLISDNFFGDTYIQGVQGLVAVESQYGLLDLYNLGGGVKVRAYGGFPLRAHQLKEGGTFFLRGTQAQFSEVAGELLVSNFRGPIEVRYPEKEARIDINSDSGPVDLILAPDDTPDLTATILYGDLDADLPLTRTAQRNLVVARHPAPEGDQLLNINASFANVSVRRKGQEPETTPRPRGDDKPFNDILTLQEPVRLGDRLIVDATIGDIRVQPTFEDTVYVTATRAVWVGTASQAPPALEALAVRLQRDSDRITLNTVVTEDMRARGASTYRVDLAIQVPASLAVEINAENGATSLMRLTGPINLKQAAGTILAEACRGPVDVSNQKGDVTLNNCSGTIRAAVRYGQLRINAPSGRVTTFTVEGNTIIDSPSNALTVRNTGGDVRILALEGVGGEYDVRVEDGDLSLLAGPASDATLNVKTERGNIQSSHPLTGAIVGDTREFSGRLRDGLYRLQLETVNGDVYVD
jgi:hypothetical protein